MMAGQNISHGKISFTSRELSIMNRLSEGKTYKEIAEVLKISPRTVGWHITRLYKKTKCHNKVAIADFARQAGLLTDSKTSQFATKEKYTFSNKKISLFMLIVLLINGICLILLIRLFLSFH